jgi:hypothetical protein
LGNLHQKSEGKVKLINEERNKTLIAYQIAGLEMDSKAILYSFGKPVVIIDYLREEAVYLEKRHKGRTRGVSRHIRETLAKIPDSFKIEPVGSEHVMNIVKALYQPMMGSVLPHAKESDNIKVREFKKKKVSLNVLQ